jgi:hypothetical protein
VVRGGRGGGGGLYEFCLESPARGVGELITSLRLTLSRSRSVASLDSEAIRGALTSCDGYVNECIIKAAAATPLTAIIAECMDIYIYIYILYMCRYRPRAGGGFAGCALGFHA